MIVWPADLLAPIDINGFVETGTDEGCRRGPRAAWAQSHPRAEQLALVPVQLRFEPAFPYSFDDLKSIVASPQAQGYRQRSVLGGSDMIAAEVEEVLDLIVG
jgi:hypothetical protein